MSIHVDVQRMRTTARGFSEDAHSLESSVHRASDGSYFLNLLAFEILLKALVLANHGPPDRNHKYAELWTNLPVEVRASVRRRAVDRMSTSVDYSDLLHLLNEWSKNFIQMRYPYEAYSGMTHEAMHALGHEWIAKDAPLAEATYRYYPEELYGLTYAVGEELDGWLATRRPN